MSGENAGFVARSTESDARLGVSCAALLKDHSVRLDVARYGAAQDLESRPWILGIGCCRPVADGAEFRVRSCPFTAGGPDTREILFVDHPEIVDRNVPLQCTSPPSCASPAPARAPNATASSVDSHSGRWPCALTSPDGEPAERTRRGGVTTGRSVRD